MDLFQLVYLEIVVEKLLEQVILHVLYQNNSSFLILVPVKAEQFKPRK